jgi:hypothetical protein
MREEIWVLRWATESKEEQCPVTHEDGMIHFVAVLRSAVRLTSCFVLMFSRLLFCPVGTGL